MKIAIDKKKVIDSVISLTARAGKGADTYDGIAATEDNTPVLEQYLSTAVTEAEGELRKRLKGSSLSDVSSNTEIVMEIKDYVRADPVIFNLIRTSMQFYLVYYVTALWVDATPGNSLAEKYSSMAESYLQTVVMSLNQRELFMVPESGYSDRNDKDYSLPEAGNGSADYSNRNDKDYSLPEAGNGSADYAKRKEDDKIARHPRCGLLENPKICSGHVHSEVESETDYIDYFEELN